MNTHQHITDFIAQQGRRPRVLVAGNTPPQETSESRRIASLLADAGLDVDLTPGDPSDAELVRQAIENDVHAIVTFADAAALRSELTSQGIDDIVVAPAAESSVAQLLGMIGEAAP